MSNDLISRSAVIKIIENEMKEKLSYVEHNAQIDILFKVKEMPTAYDVDKVVEWLEERKEYLTNEFVLADISRLSKEKTLERINEIAGMIKFVKSGGIEQ